MLTPGRIAVVLVSARNSLNIGAAARAMANFGFADLRVVNPYDASFLQARSAVGAGPVLAAAKHCGSLAEAIADCTLVLGTAAHARRRPQHAVDTPADAAPAILEHVESGDSHRAAILFGSEKTGLTNEQLGYCHRILEIPTLPAQPSMNLGQAVAVCLYELVRSRSTERSSSGPAAASAGSLERLCLVLLDVLRSSGYLQPGEAREDSVRRLIYRMGLSADDSTVLLGMLRQTLWKLQAPR